MCCANRACVGIFRDFFCSIPSYCKSFTIWHVNKPPILWQYFLTWCRAQFLFDFWASVFAKDVNYCTYSLNNRILITLKLQLQFLMQNTRHYMFSHSLNINSCKGNLTKYSGLSIRTTNLYCEYMVCLNLTHALPGHIPMAVVTFSANSKLRFEIFLWFLYFYLHKIVGINFRRNVCVSYLCM